MMGARSGNLPEPKTKAKSQKIVAMLRVKDGILFIHQWLENIGRLVDEIVAVDNGSTDGTLEILKKHLKVVELRQTEGFHEGRDKILAYELARTRNPDWVLWLDVDEVFEKRMSRPVLERMMSKCSVAAYRFRRFHFHRDYYHFEARYDKLADIAMPSRTLWRQQPHAFFHDRVIHNGDIQGIIGKTTFSKYRLKHFGSVDREYLNRKTDTYIRVDPGHFDLYTRHRDQDLPVWKWYEWEDNSLAVIAQNLVLDSIYLAKKVKYLFARFKRLAGRGGNCVSTERELDERIS